MRKLIMIFFLFCPSAYALEGKDCIKAIIGEAEGESFLGKQAIANAIHNRNSLKGVYGVHSKRVIRGLYSVKTFNDACRAWGLRDKDITGHATGWGNSADLVHFKRTKWFKNCVVTAHIGHHFFYKEKNG